MRFLILGLGNIGKALATKLREQGHTVHGTTTSPDKVEGLRSVVDEVSVLFGHEQDKVAAAARNCDAIVVTVSPDVRKSGSVEEREAHYREVLLDSCTSAAASCDRVIFASSFSVYGDGGAGDRPITEDTPCNNSEEPSSKYFQAAEQAVLANAAGCVLRFPDMYGAPGDLSYPDRVRLAHEHFGGKTIFSADAPLYCIHYYDVVGALVHAIDHELTGIFNVCDDDNLPYTNQQVFDAICDAHALDRLDFLGHIKAPNRKISAGRIYATGYRVRHPDPNAELVVAAQSGPQ